MVLFAVSGKAHPGTMEEFAQKWQDVYRRHFPQMPGFVQAYFSANPEAHTWLALALWSARPDEAQLRQAIQELGGQIASIIAGSPFVEWYEVLQQIAPG